MITTQELEKRLDMIERKAWKSLSGYHFETFGAWALQWMVLNSTDNKPRINPFGILVQTGREKINAIRQYGK